MIVTTLASVFEDIDFFVGACFCGEGFMVELSLAVLGVSFDVGGCVEGKVFAVVVCLSGVGEVLV